MASSARPRAAESEEVRAALDLLWAEFHRLNALYCSGTLRLDEIRLSPRKQYGGYCMPAKFLIVLSLQALREHGFEETLDTFRHEVAHLVHPDHSKAFWALAAKFGSTRKYALPPKERSATVHTRYVYECPACATQVFRQKRLVRASCARCDKAFNPRFVLRLISSPALRQQAERKPETQKASASKARTLLTNALSLFG